MMRAHPFGLLIILAFAVVAAPSVAEAQKKAKPVDKTTEAQRLYDEGKRLYNLGKFAEAVEQFEKAYDLYRAPEFLFNIGQCYRNLHNYDKAIFVFESYLREKPNTDKRALIEELIAEMKKERAAEQDRVRQDDANRQEIARKQREAEVAVIERRKQADLDRIERERAEEARRDQDAQRPVYKKWWFWTVAGGVVAAAAGGYVYATSGEALPSGSLGTIDGR